MFVFTKLGRFIYINYWNLNCAYVALWTASVMANWPSLKGSNNK